MSNVYFTTHNSDRTGRASYFFNSESDAKARCDDQNKRASEMGMKVKYAVCSVDKSTVEAKELR